MAIPSRPIGQDPQSQLLWNISKQMEQLIAQVGAVVKNTAPTTTTSTTTAAPIVYNFYNVGPNSSNACFGGVPPISVGVANNDMYNATIAYAQSTFSSGPNTTIYIGFNYAGTNYYKEFITNGDATSATATGSNLTC